MVVILGSISLVARREVDYTEGVTDISKVLYNSFVAVRREKGTNQGTGSLGRHGIIFSIERRTLHFWGKAWTILRRSRGGETSPETPSRPPIPHKVQNGKPEKESQLWSTTSTKSLLPKVELLGTGG